MYLNVTAAILFLAGLYVASERRSRFYFVLVLAVVTALLSFYHQTGNRSVDVAFQLCLSLFLLTMIIQILKKAVLKNEKVSREKIAAALCVYLLAGYLWACLYTFADILNPGAFQNNLRGYPDLLYYSFITLATVGYGDITPVTPLARSLAVLEAITGQLYLAVMIARLVGLHIVHAAEDDTIKT